MESTTPHLWPTVLKKVVSNRVKRHLLLVCVNLVHHSHLHESLDVYVLLAQHQVLKLGCHLVPDRDPGIVREGARPGDQGNKSKLGYILSLKVLGLYLG